MYILAKRIQQHSADSIIKSAYYYVSEENHNCCLILFAEVSASVRPFLK